MSDSTAEQSTETRLRVLTWNIWWRYGPWEARQPAIAATLESLDADVIALQEVWDDGTVNQAAALADGLGYHHVFDARDTHAGVRFGNAILSRWPILNSRSRPLPGCEETGEGRLAVFAEIDGPRGPIGVFSTHLNWRYEHSQVRQRQVADLAEFVADADLRDFPPVICGDFNAEPTSDEIRMMTGETSCPVEGLTFRDAWRDGGDGGPGFTWSNANPFAVGELEHDRRIDYIFIGRAEAKPIGYPEHCRVAGDEAVDGIWPSDHFAVLAELRY
jgi:endonuclease/exonuclease/phosphatase family metal-dependent hydrolase